MISIRNVSKSYNNIIAVNKLNLEIEKGEFCVLLGPSGCGKSTTIKLINSLVIPDEGEIFFEGINISEYKEDELRRKIGYVIQSTGLFPHYSVYENISVVPNLLKWPKRDTDKKVDEMLELVGLSKNIKVKFPHELSGGEGQRVGVARALAGNPEVLLMDEPFGSVDPLSRERLQSEFLKIQKTLKKTILFVTHDVEEAVRLADRIVIMNDGNLIKQGRPADFIQESQISYINEFLGDDFALKLLSRYKVSDCKLVDINEADYKGLNLNKKTNANIYSDEIRNQISSEYPKVNEEINNCEKANVKMTKSESHKSKDRATINEIDSSKVNKIIGESDISIENENPDENDSNVKVFYNDSLNKVLSKMLIKGQRHALVFKNEGSFVGILTMNNLLDIIRDNK